MVGIPERGKHHNGSTTFEIGAINVLLGCALSHHDFAADVILEAVHPCTLWCVRCGCVPVMYTTYCTRCHEGNRYDRVPNVFGVGGRR